IYNLDERKKKPRSVDDDLINDVKEKVRKVAAALRNGALPTQPVAKKCAGCDYRGMCSDGARVASSK
ncbi:MAG TPA: PD-(D/E)XK nuclease family protein, partial [Steroidobacteraceae bacterium]